MISDRISEDIPSQFLMHFCSLKLRKPHKAASHPMRCDIINDVKLFPVAGGGPNNVFFFVNIFHRGPIVFRGVSIPEFLRKPCDFQGEVRTPLSLTSGSVHAIQTRCFYIFIQEST